MPAQTPHLEDAAGLLMGNMVLLFAFVCALNSLGIRLWERGTPDYEHLLLAKLYPWLLLTACAGGVTEWLHASWSRPFFMACALAALLLLLLHLARGKMSTALRRALADAAMILAAAAGLAAS